MSIEERDRLASIAKRLEQPGGQLAAATETRHVMRILAEAEQMSNALADVWTAVESDDEDKLSEALSRYDFTHLPTANWPHGQGATPLAPQLLQAIREGNEAQPQMAVTALIGEVDRLAYEVARWRFNYDSADRRAKAMSEASKRDRKSDRATLARLWSLVDRKRKTVPMDALRAALTDPIAKTEAAAPDPGGLSAADTSNDQQPGGLKS